MSFLDFNSSHHLSLVDKNFENCFKFPPFRAEQIHLFPYRFLKPSVSLSKIESLYKVAGKFLWQLNLHSSHLTDQCFRNLITFCPNITHLILGCNNNLTDEVFRSLPPGLTFLQLNNWNKKLNEASLTALPKTINSLEFHFCELKITTLLTTHMTGLESLDLIYSPFCFSKLPKTLKIMTYKNSDHTSKESFRAWLTPYFKDIDIDITTVGRNRPIVTIEATN